MPPRLGLALALELIGRPPSASTATVTWTHSASIAPPPSAIEFAEVSALGDDTLALAAGQGPESVAVFTYDRRAEGWSAPTRIDCPGLAEPVALALDDGILTLVGESDGSVGIATAARDGGVSGRAISVLSGHDRSGVSPPGSGAGSAARGAAGGSPSS